MKRDIYTRLVEAKGPRIYGKDACYLLKPLGSEIPRSVKVELQE